MLLGDFLFPLANRIHSGIFYLALKARRACEVIDFAQSLLLVGRCLSCHESLHPRPASTG